MADLVGRSDVESVLRAFYGRAFDDLLLGHVFRDVVHMDLEQHLPVITDFWMTVLFDTGTYRGRTMEVHRRVHRLTPLTEQHFARWLELWDDALGRYDGPVATAAIAHAHRMAPGFLRHLQGDQDPRRSLPVVPA